MYRKHKETMKAYIARLEKAHAAAVESREELWHALNGVLKNKVGIEEARAVVNSNAHCSCGAHASCWDGEHWKICETCRSS